MTRLLSFVDTATQSSNDKRKLRAQRLLNGWRTAGVWSNAIQDIVQEKSINMTEDACVFSRAFAKHPVVKVSCNRFRHWEKGESVCSTSTELHLHLILASFQDDIF